MVRFILSLYFGPKAVFFHYDTSQFIFSYLAAQQTAEMIKNLRK